MKCILMNKNTEEVIDIDYDPLILKSYYEEEKDELVY